MKRMILGLALISALSAADAPSIPGEVQQAYDKAMLKVREAQAAYELAKAATALLDAQKEQGVAVENAMSKCGKEFILWQEQGQLSCIPRPKVERGTPTPPPASAPAK